MTAPAPEELLLTITPDGEKCGECRHIALNGSQWWCRLYFVHPGICSRPAVRCESCLVAARAARELREGNARLREALKLAVHHWTHCTVKCDHRECADYKTARAALREGR